MCTWYWPITILTIVLSYLVIHVAVKMLRVRVATMLTEPMPDMARVGLRSDRISRSAG